MTDSELFIYALVAALIAYRLWSVLGKTNGTEKQRAVDIAEFANKIQAEIAAKKAKTAIATQTKPQATPEPEQIPAFLADDFAKAKKIDQNFSLKKFNEGATGAFEIIIKAFAEGKKDALKFLLSADIYQSFEAEIDARAAKKITASSSIYSMQPPEVLDIEVNGNICQVITKFVSEQFNFSANEKGEVVEGSKTQTEHASDVWTFERDLTSKKPNWTVVGIQSA